MSIISPALNPTPGLKILLGLAAETLGAQHGIGTSSTFPMTISSAPPTLESQKPLKAKPIHHDVTSHEGVFQARYYNTHQHTNPHYGQRFLAAAFEPERDIREDMFMRLGTEKEAEARNHTEAHAPCLQDRLQRLKYVQMCPCYSPPEEPVSSPVDG
ncbi:hypothetical protein BGZ92_008232 [Podila epicladia]|nr:hypothetical protein BGZ92_008232 [Podila epicladia]